MGPLYLGTCYHSLVVCRLHTIIDCDMVLVMDNGLAAEWGRPATLLDNPNGTFTSKRTFPPPLPRLSQSLSQSLSQTLSALVSPAVSALSPSVSYFGGCLSNSVTMLAGMVRETGHAAEQFLRSVAAGQADNLAERDQQAAAALQRVNTSPDWHTDCRYGSMHAL